MECHSATSEINELLRLSQRTLNFEGEPGFRKVDVYCRASTGEKIRFAAPDHIPAQLLGLMKKVKSLLEDQNDIEKVARAFSIFWLGFIAIHPFINGNGRTGKAYLMKKTQELGLELKKTEILDSILLLGEPKRDLSLLEIYFKSNLTIKG